MKSLTPVSRRTLTRSSLFAALALAISSIGLYSWSWSQSPSYLDLPVRALAGASTLGIGASSYDPFDGALVSIVKNARRKEDALDAFREVLDQATTAEGKFYALVGLYVEGDEDFAAYKERVVADGGRVQHRCNFGVSPMEARRVWDHLTSPPTGGQTDHKRYIEWLMGIARQRSERSG